jgi:signal transduction histidine kinase
LTAEYLQFSRLPESQLSKGNIHRVIEEIVEFWRHELGQKKIEIECHLPNPFSEEATVELRFDRVQIRRAMLNIIRNAIEAMPKGGTLRIWTEEKGRRVYVHIEDTGIGIPEDEIKKIFDPFFTTKDFGTGLGLAVVQQIVSEHGGEIFCTSKVGQGTTFTIVLPLDEAKGAK